MPQDLLLQITQTFYTKIIVMGNIEKIIQAIDIQLIQKK